ncbi:MAG: polysaccharide export protein EpsE [Oxalobacteraceae bacterium]|nr:polysaccharide export protein EpsE [Oxalobacteraceae bacterium]
MKKIMMGLLVLALGAWSFGASAADVLLGPSDVLKISVYGNPDLSLETRVSQTGGITFPLVGEVKVGGLAIPAAEKEIAGLLMSGGFVLKPQVNILVTSRQSQLVSVLGQVAKPGRYPIDGKHSLIDILALAGGVATDGGDKVSLIRKRDGQSQKEVVDLIEMVRSGNLKKDLDLKTDDVVYVERAPKFYVYGEVQKPGPYRLERNMTVQQVLSVGGGLTARGTERGIRVKRRDADGKVKEFRADLENLVEMDDVIYVKESWF